MKVALTRVTRAADGKVHRPGEVARVVREQNTLGRRQLVARFDDDTTTVLYPEEVEEIGQ
jgi:hypothetical protein